MNKLTTTTLSPEDLADLEWAHRRLEHPSLAARLSNVIGSPIEHGLELLSKRWYERLHAEVEKGIRRALDIAIVSLGNRPHAKVDDSMHKLMAMGTGALSGLFGPVALLIELPVTTSVMLRSIAGIAQSQGEDLSDVKSRLACMEVFALGGRSDQDRYADTGYYGLRVTLSLHFSAILEYTGSGSGIHIPAGLNLVRAIAARFGLVVSDKAAAQLIPVASAVTGGLLNVVFMQHFQDVGRGHFIVRRLEREYGPDVVRTAYESLSRAEREAAKEYSPIEGW